MLKAESYIAVLMVLILLMSVFFYKVQKSKENNRSDTVINTVGMVYPPFVPLQIPENNKSSGRVNIKSIVISTFDTVRTKQVTGKVHAKRKIEISPEVPGVIKKTEKLFREGEKFNKGEPMIQIESSEAKLKLKSARSSYRSLISSLLPDIRLDYRSEYEKFLEYYNGINTDNILSRIPETDNSQLRNFFESNQLFAQYYQIKSLEEKLEKFTIRAPFDGVVAFGMVNEGQIVSPLYQLGIFLDDASYEFRTSVSHDFASHLNSGTKINLTNGDGTEEWTGVIRSQNPILSKESYQVQIYVDMNGEGLRDGMILSAEFETDDFLEVASIPRTALHRSGHVYKIVNNQVVLHPVKLIHIDRNTVIVKGLSDDSRIIPDPMKPKAGLKLSIAN